MSVRNIAASSEPLDLCLFVRLPGYSNDIVSHFKDQWKPGQALTNKASRKSVLTREKGIAYTAILFDTVPFYNSSVKSVTEMKTVYLSLIEAGGEEFETWRVPVFCECRCSCERVSVPVTEYLCEGSLVAAVSFG